MSNVHAASANPKTFTGTITGTGQVSDLCRIDTLGIKIFGFQIRRPETKYIVGFCDVTLDNGNIIHRIGERNITEKEFNSLRIYDKVTIQFDM